MLEKITGVGTLPGKINVTYTTYLVTDPETLKGVQPLGTVNLPFMYTSSGDSIPIIKFYAAEGGREIYWTSKYYLSDYWINKYRVDFYHDWDEITKGGKVEFNTLKQGDIPLGK